MFRSDGMMASISPNSERITSVCRQIEVNRTAAPAAGVQHLEQLVHQLEHRRQRGVPLDRCGDRGLVRIAFTSV